MGRQQRAGAVAASRQLALELPPHDHDPLTLSYMMWGEKWEQVKGGYPSVYSNLESLVSSE